MKLDIVRAWKDETYRQSLSEAQMNTIPVNPAGELSDADLATLWGAGDGNSFSNSFGDNSFSNDSHDSHSGEVSSFAVLLCETTISSVNILQQIAIILSVATTTCVSVDH
ncbi:MAG TPA: mersacidin/lichenicidin family type 2 lantibiotic [Ktedonobacteraceae bacterium]|nr:mersacidin/lichenicidin family type 2 lantibiotic [Ktedonobacteraceae bacterium]